MNTVSTFKSCISSQEIQGSNLVSSMFDILQTVNTIFTSSTKRSEVLEKEQDKVVGALKIRNLSQTRWIAGQSLLTAF